MKTNISPVSAANRIEILDVLRGLAILGILVVNMQLFYQPLTTVLIGYQGHESMLDKVAEVFIKFFFEGKFYVIFSFLFGYGFFIFINKESNGAVNPLPFFRRRAFFLLVFGIAHLVFLWGGDILIYYALFGFLLILFRKVSDKGLLRWAIAFALIPLVLTTLFAGLMYMAMNIPEAAGQAQASFEQSMAQTIALHQRASEVYSSGSFQEIMNIRLTEYANVSFGAILFFYPVVMTMFLLGYLAARRGILKNIAENIGLLKKAAVWGIAVGAPLAAVYAFSYYKVSPVEMNLTTISATLSSTFGGIFLGMFYVSGMALLLHKGKLSYCKKQLAPVGRMALTNYLLQTLVCTTMFYGYGFGLFEKITVWQGLVLSFIIFGLQIPSSRWWLNKFYYGPFEWLWRCLTYWKIQPLRRHKDYCP